MHFDIFNGDADGICALHQLRLAEPKPEARLITGVKRDVQLLSQVVALHEAGLDLHGVTCTVLDVSMASNMEALEIILAAGGQVFYADHHYAGDIPNEKGLTVHIDPSPDLCTSLIVDRLLAGKYRGWAVAAAFGDNLHGPAQAAAHAFTAAEIAALRELGELMNYNGYGETLADLHFSPQELYAAVQPYADPLAFHAQSPVLAKLRAGFAEDMAAARGCIPELDSSVGRVYRFPGTAWAKRVAGVFSNEKAREKPGLAHALLVENSDGSYRISVRAPLANKKGADRLCLAFPTGGGRAAAAGINALPPEMLADFLGSFEMVFATAEC